MQVISVNKPDPTWEIALVDRHAILWVGESAFSRIGKSAFLNWLNGLLVNTWAAVYVDVPLEITPEVRNQLKAGSGQFILRHYAEDAGPDNLPPNRTPIFWLRGKLGKTRAGDTGDPMGLLLRFSMLQRAPVEPEVFAIGIDRVTGIQALSEAAALSSAFKSLVIVCEHLTESDFSDDKIERVFHWRATNDEFESFVVGTSSQQKPGEGLSVVVMGNSRLEKLDISTCVDPSYPITEYFEFITSHDIYRDPEVREDDVRLFLEDPTANWGVYSAGVPYPRHLEFERNLKKYLKRFKAEGPSHTFTGWIPAEDGAGATTVLRQIAFNVAREGFPVMLALPAIQTIDFRQLIAFIRKTQDLAIQNDSIRSGFPWIIIFDAEQTTLHWDQIRGLANGIKNLKRAAVVIAVRKLSDLTAFEKALGTNHRLGDELRNKFTADEGVMLGEHLGRFVPAYAKRSKVDWSSFINSTVITRDGASDSLFWLALRFWLVRIPGAEGSFREWLAAKFKNLVNGKADICAGLLETAVLAKHRLFMPIALLPEESQFTIKNIPLEEIAFLGFRRFDGGRSVSFVHPMIADEVLKIASGFPFALDSIEKPSCIGTLDLELHLLGRLITRPYAGSRDCLLLIEELVTTALRVDPRTSPSTYHVRDRIVQILENAHSSIWDTSQVFNHHIAKARRHLAIDPPSMEWGVPARREQLELSQRHLLDALQNITPVEDKHCESELNLCVSMALTLVARSKIEQLDNNLDLAKQFDDQAEQYYGRAQTLDADNSYVLENFARYKLRIAKQMDPCKDRTRLIVEAIQLLEIEQDLDDFGTRVYETTEELANAYSMLTENDETHQLDKLAESGFEPAIVAVAKLRLHEPCNDEHDRKLSLAEAEKILLTVPPTGETWRSQLPLYRIVSHLRPYDFNRRLEVLNSLDRFDAFAWPQQLQLEFAILLLQAGDEYERQKGKVRFKQIRDQLLSRTSSITVPPELKFLRDPSTNYMTVLSTFIVVKNVSDVGKSSFGIPDGWKTVDVVFRDFHFGRNSIRVNDELDCNIQFTNFGPQAVPLDPS